MTLAILVGVFIVTMAMGIPIAFVFGIGSIIYFIFISNIPITIIGQCSVQKITKIHHVGLVLFGLNHAPTQ